MITTKAVAVWMGMPEQQIKRYAPKTINKDVYTDRQGLIIALAAFLDINYESAESFYYKYKKQKRRKR